MVTPLEDRLDAANSPLFKEKMRELINGGRRRLVLDLTNVDFMDSSGLGAVVFTMKSIGAEGDLGVCCVKEQVMGLFRLTRMDRVLRIFDSLSEAEEAVAP